MNTSNVIQCYNATADAYAAAFAFELAQKPLDQLLLNAFADAHTDQEMLLELGCGPGQVAAYLASRGVSQLLATDLSVEMIRVAREMHPHLQFEVADMLQLPFADQHFASVVAFYAIVHFEISDLPVAFAEIFRVLKAKGAFLFSFHVGAGSLHRDELLGKAVDIDFYFFSLQQVLELARAAGFTVREALVRQPYPEVEYPSERAYVWLEKP